MRREIVGMKMGGWIDERWRGIGGIKGEEEVGGFKIEKEQQSVPRGHYLKKPLG